MRLINVETLKLEEFFGDKVPPYAVLSHTWGKGEEELSFRDIEKGNIEKAGKIKLEGCCEQAKKDGLRYAWIDTCCINKDSSRELDEAINSMFRWYRDASICYAYLSDVPSGDNSWDPGSKFFSSRWFRRGWTLQELLAPPELRFYDQTWKSKGPSVDISKEIETITGIPERFLLGWEDFRKASVAQRMSWAAKRRTTRTEDIAYCLLGIFDVTMPMVYGEGGEKAFSRLQQEIMKNTGDHSILAWGLDTAESTRIKSTDVLSAGILATAPSNFANCGHIVQNKQDATLVTTFDIYGGRLRVHLPLYTTSAGEIYGLLNCGPNEKQVVGIPLRKTVSGAPADEYLRPQGQYPILFAKPASTDLTKLIHIRMERQNKAHEVTSRRYWLRIDGHQKINLKLNGVHPPVSWEKGRALIANAADSDGNLTRRYFTRFRTQDEGSRDIVVVLEFDISGLHPQARYHVMTSSRDAALEDLSRKLMYMRPEAFGKQTASNGDLDVDVTVKEEHIAQEPMFVVRLARASRTPKVTVDANWELQQVDRKLEFVEILQQEDQLRLVVEQSSQQRNKKMATLDAMRERLALVKENLEKLKEEQRLLEDGLEKGDRDMELLIARHEAARELQDVLLGRESEIQQHLDKHETKQGPRNWLETTIKTQLGPGKIGRDLKDVGNFDPNRPQSSTAEESGQNIDSQTPLSWAASNGHVPLVRQLLEKGGDVEAKNNNGWTPLMWAAQNGHEAVARLLIEKGGDVKAKNSNGWTPLKIATQNGHDAVARLLVEKGGVVEAKNSNDRTPLKIATQNGHDAVARLVEKGGVVEAKNSNDRTPLKIATQNGHDAVARVLVEKGSDVEVKANEGRTPPMFAVSRTWRVELQKLEGHTGPVYAVAFSPDGSQLASASPDKTVRLWNAKTGREVQKLQWHTGPVYAVTFSPDGSQLASASSDKTVRLWNAKTGRKVQKFEGHTDSVWAVAFSPDGSQLASASPDKTVRLWNAKTGREVQKLEGHTSSAWAVAFSPDGSQLASASSDKTVRLWNAKAGQERLKLQGHTDPARAVAFSPDGSQLVSASSDKTVRLWNAKTGREVQKFEGHTDSVWAVAFSPDGSQLASASSDGTVRLWNAKTGSEVQKFGGYTGLVRAVAFSPDGSQLALASYDKTVRLGPTDRTI